MVKNLINFWIAIAFLFPQFLGLAIGFLQLLQPKPYTTKTDFIRSLIGKFGLKSIEEILELWQNIDFVD